MRSGFVCIIAEYLLLHSVRRDSEENGAGGYEENSGSQVPDGTMR